MCFIDLTKAYDSVNQDALTVVLRNYKVASHLVDIISTTYTNTWSQVRTTEVASEEFQVVSGVRQGCILSPLLFNCFMDRVLRETVRMTPVDWRIEYTTRTDTHMHTCTHIRMHTLMALDTHVDTDMYIIQLYVQNCTFFTI